MTKNEKFEYTYTAPTEAERREIMSIKNNYAPTLPKKETKLERLRKLDSKVSNTATIVALILSVPGFLIFGTGMTMVLEWSLISWGIVVSAVGVIPMALAYPAYKHVLNKGKKKYGAEILKLSEELLEIKNK
ncbi:MAG: dihydropteridine reductase [Clostridia bacterium]|nr:dihydropteridine reductase [Clostridia bacterium]